MFRHLEDVLCFKTRLVAGLKYRLDTGTVHVGFVGVKVAQERSFFLVIRNFLVVFIPAATHTRLCARAALLLS